MEVSMEENPKVPTTVLKRFDFIIIAVIVYFLNSCSNWASSSKVESLQEDIAELKKETLILKQQIEQLSDKHDVASGSN